MITKKVLTIALTIFAANLIAEDKTPCTVNDVRKVVIEVAHEFFYGKNSKAVIDGFESFGDNLYDQLAKTPGNLFFSPYSIATTLAMTYAGAKGATQQEMAKVLYFPNNPFLHLSIGIIQNDLEEDYNDQEKNAKIVLSVANKIFVQNNTPLLEEFTSTLQTHYNSAIENVDFDQPEQAAKTINSWVSEETRKKIEQIVGANDIANTKLVLANAIYFKAKWSKPFPGEMTQEDSFFVDASHTTNINMMQQTNSFRYTENELFQSIILPYAWTDCYMIITLPKAIDGLSLVEKTMENVDLDYKETTVSVRIPRFKIESSYELQNHLAAMGMPSAFTPAADFSGITGNRDLFISKIIHKTYLSVAEEGTEAAAATAATMARSCRFPEETPITFTANHPFMFAIFEKSGLMLFYGRVTNPHE